jgi:hypothetical protein
VTCDLVVFGRLSRVADHGGAWAALVCVQNAGLLRVHERDQGDSATPICLPRPVSHRCARPLTS